MMHNNVEHETGKAECFHDLPKHSIHILESHPLTSSHKPINYVTSSTSIMKKISPNIDLRGTKKPKADSLLIQAAPTNLDFEKALMFFHAYMYGPLQGKLRLYRARDVHTPGKVMSSDWEVFASILVRDVGTKLTRGIDLSGYEVKSAENGGSYEYQYHKNTGKEKLRSDMSAGHLFFDHSDNLKKVDLRYAPGRQLKEFFERWLQEYPDPYPQRYRKNIPFKWVKQNAELLMSLRDGEVTYPILAAEDMRETASGLRPGDTNSARKPKQK